MGSAWPGELSVCVCMCVFTCTFTLQQDAYTRGMSIPFVDPWERSSISLLGTALMRPGILPFIPHSLQLGTAHSFRYGHSKVFVYTETMQWAKTAHSPLRRSVCAHAIPHIPGKLYLVSCLTATVVIDVCARLLPLETNPQAENAKKGHMVMICRFS